jgi:hypothetical protein
MNTKQHDSIERNDKISPFNTTPYNYKIERFSAKAYTFEIIIPKRVFHLEVCPNIFNQIKNTVPVESITILEPESITEEKVKIVKIIVKLEDKTRPPVKTDDVRRLVIDTLSAFIVDLQSKHGIMIETIKFNDYESTLTSIERLS